MDIICVNKKKLTGRQITLVVEIKDYEPCIFAPHEDLARMIQLAFAGMERDMAYNPKEATKEASAASIKGMDGKRNGVKP